MWKKPAVITTLKIKPKDIQVPCLLKYPGITLRLCLEQRFASVCKSQATAPRRDGHPKGTEKNPAQEQG